jgi:hypothetical protein
MAGGEMIYKLTITPDKKPVAFSGIYQIECDGETAVSDLHYWQSLDWLLDRVQEGDKVFVTHKIKGRFMQKYTVPMEYDYAQFLDEFEIPF